MTYTGNVIDNSIRNVVQVSCFMLCKTGKIGKKNTKNNNEVPNQMIYSARHCCWHLSLIHLISRPLSPTCYILPYRENNGRRPGHEAIHTVVSPLAWRSVQKRLSTVGLWLPEIAVWSSESCISPVCALHLQKKRRENGDQMSRFYYSSGVKGYFKCHHQVRHDLTFGSGEGDGNLSFRTFT